MPEYPEPVQTVTTDIVIPAHEMATFFQQPTGLIDRGMFVRTSIVPGGEITISVHAVSDDESRCVASRVVASFATPPADPARIVGDALDDENPPGGQPDPSPAVPERMAGPTTDTPWLPREA